MSGLYAFLWMYEPLVYMLAYEAREKNIYMKKKKLKIQYAKSGTRNIGR